MKNKKKSIEQRIDPRIDISKQSASPQSLQKQGGKPSKCRTSTPKPCTETEHINIELSMRLSEVFDALNRISAGDPTVRIDETSNIELISQLKHLVNVTGQNIGEIVDQSHEFAMGLAEHFDVLHKVSKGDLRARVSGTSDVELLESLKNVTNETIESISKEIDERREAEESLRKLEELESSLLSAIPHAVIGLHERTIVFANKAIRDVFGWEPRELIGGKTRVLYRTDNEYEEIGHRFYPVLEQKQTHSEEFHCRHKNGGDILCKVHAAVIGRQLKGKGIVVMYEDVTERKRADEEKCRLEAQLFQAQKMEAVGQLAGGIAHDFNNILTAIVGYGNLLKTELMPDDPLISYAAQILNAAERAANLTHDLLTFSRRQFISPRPVHLNTIIRCVERLLARLIGEDIELSIELAETDLTVMADSTHIDQVLMNLAANARDAMPDKGSLIIRTERLKLDNRFVKAHGYGKPGNYALISFEDTGAGMDKKTRMRIFEPFFTTKEVGKGTGLGLAIVYGIIKQHDGYINVYSEPGKGTTFKIYLPLTQSIAEDVRQTDPLPAQKGNETILIVEDDRQVRNLMKEVLSKSGYSILEAVDGEDAMSVFSENKDAIHLTILDVMMPRKNGKEAYDAMQKTSPDAKVIFISGYSADVIQRKNILKKGSHFISKPVSPTELLNMVRTVLDKKK
jgi:PAS domain S-box-containing protein